MTPDLLHPLSLPPLVPFGAPLPQAMPSALASSRHLTLSPSPRIIWDLDDTLADFAETVCNHLPTLSGTRADWQTWQSYNACAPLFASTHAGFLHCLIDAEILEVCNPYPTTRPTLEHFRSLGFTQSIVTARAWHPRGAALTLDWLTKHDLVHFFSDVIVVTDNKIEAINSLSPATLYVDDAPHHIEAALAQCQVDQVVLISRPWNMMYHPPQPHARRINTLSELHIFLP